MLVVATYAEAVLARRASPTETLRWTDEYGRSFVWPPSNDRPLPVPQPSRVKLEDGTFAVHSSRDEE